MNQVKAKIPKQVEAALDQQARASEGWANRLRWWFAIAFGLAALWSWGEASAAKYIYLTLAILWSAAALTIRGRLRREFSASLATLTTNVDLTIINLGLLLCWWQGLFAQRASEIFFCYFPVLVMVAMRYRPGLVVKAGLYAAGFYGVVASLAAGFPLVQLAMLSAMTVVAGLVSWKPRDLLVEAATDAAREAYDLGLRERERELAGAIQERILSRELPETPGLWVVAKHDAGVEQGGDYYHVFATGRGPLVIVGDLGGRGIEATLAVAQLHLQLSQILLREERLTAVLEALNTALWRQYRGSLAFTCVLARWEGDELHYINAGHLPMIQLRQRKRSRLPMTSEPVGASEQATFTEERVSFPARDLLLLYTDGLYSELTAERERGVEEIERVTDSFSHAEVNTLCYRVFDCSQPGRDAPRDDRTLVVIRRQPVAAEKTEHEAQTGAAV